MILFLAILPNLVWHCALYRVSLVTAFLQVATAWCSAFWGWWCTSTPRGIHPSPRASFGIGLSGYVLLYSSVFSSPSLLNFTLSVSLWPLTSLPSFTLEQFLSTTLEAMLLANSSVQINCRYVQLEIIGREVKLAQGMQVRSPQKGILNMQQINHSKHIKTCNKSLKHRQINEIHHISAALCQHQVMSCQKSYYLAIPVTGGYMVSTSCSDYSDVCQSFSTEFIS